MSTGRFAGDPSEVTGRRYEVQRFRDYLLQFTDSQAEFLYRRMDNYIRDRFRGLETGEAKECTSPECGDGMECFGPCRPTPSGETPKFTELEGTCNNCGHLSVPRDASYCPYCGAVRTTPSAPAEKLCGGASECVRVRGHIGPHSWERDGVCYREPTETPPVFTPEAPPLTPAERQTLQRLEKLEPFVEALMQREASRSPGSGWSAEDYAPWAAARNLVNARKAVER